MDNKEFIELFLERMRQFNIPERHKDNHNEINYYLQDYSAINQQYNAETYDEEGGQIWVTIPFNKDFIIQLNFRYYDWLKFKANPDIKTDAWCGNIFFIYKWNNLGIYRLKSSDLTEKPKKSFQRAKECLGKEYHYYSPDYYLIEFIMEMINKSEDWVTDNCDILGWFVQQDYLEGEWSQGKVNKMLKGYKENIKESVKETFGKEYIVR